jgi:hypothetical protein
VVRVHVTDAEPADIHKRNWSTAMIKNLPPGTTSFFDHFPAAVE